MFSSSRQNDLARKTNLIEILKLRRFQSKVPGNAGASEHISYRTHPRHLENVKYESIVGAELFSQLAVSQPDKNLYLPKIIINVISIT
jgi:hypothetical protein